MDDELLGRQSAFDEAKALHGMTGEENTIEELRELIVVPPKIERALRAFTQARLQEVHWIESTLMFREAVLCEFERLIREGASVGEFPELEAMESGASSEAVAFTR